MALRLAEYVVRGGFYNLRRNSTHGWLQLRDKQVVVTFELTGNPGADLEGKRIRFECGLEEWGGCERKSAKDSKIPHRFVGAVGEMTADRQTRVFKGSVEDFFHRSKLGEPPPTFWKRCLYLEWFGTGGRVVLEMPDPVIWEVIEVDGEDCMVPLPELGPEPFDPNDPPKGEATMEVTVIEMIDDETALVSKHEVKADVENEPMDPEDDPYALFSDDFKKMMQQDDPKRKSGVEDHIERIERIVSGEAEGDLMRNLIGEAPDWSQMSGKDL